MILKSFTFEIPNLNLPSVNSIYYANKSHGLKPEAKEAAFIINQHLKKHSDKMEELRMFFKPKFHVYSLKITQWNNHLNKSGSSSSASRDLSNIEKFVQDCIFSTKHWPTIPTLNIDDKYVWQLKSQKKQGELKVSITIEILDMAQYLAQEIK